MENRSGTDTSEAVALQPEKIKLLYARLGKREAEELICRATEKIAQHIQQICQAEAATDTAQLVRSTRLVSELSLHMGLTDLNRVANDVSHCVLRGDEPAIAATSARLGRLSEKSLRAVWELQDRSG